MPCHLMLTLFQEMGASQKSGIPDDISIKALNRSLTTYKLFGVTYGNVNHFKSAMCLPSLWYHRLCGTSMMAHGNIIKEDQDFGTVESQKACHSIWLFPTYALYLHQ